jgi:hypothetical protein
MPVVHICLDLASATAELPAVVSGDVARPSASGLGSNAAKPAGDRKVPKIIFFAAQIPAEEVESVSAAVKASAPDAQFVQVTLAELKAAGSTGPNVDVFVKVLKDKLAGL